jgi:phage major head subunit gpT-like protein
MRAPFCREVGSNSAFEVYADLGAVPWPVQNGGQAAGTGTDGRTGAQQVSGLHEGGPITVLGGNERGLVVYNQDWDIAIGVYHNAINDGKVSLESWAGRCGARFEQHMDYLAFAALNSGDGSTYGYGYDKLAFFYSSHIDPGAEYQTAQDNVYDLSLSLDNFETVRIAAGSFLDDRGKPSGMVHDLLIHSINLERTAAQIVSNPNAYDTSDQEINPYRGKVQGLTVPGGWFDSTAWVLCCSNMPEKPINLQMRQRPELVYWDDHTQGGGVRYYKWHARYVPFYGDWRLAIMGKS